MSEEGISTEMLKLCINTLNTDAMTPEEEALGYFTRTKLKNLSTWKEWKAGEKKQIDQFMMQGMFGNPIYLWGYQRMLDLKLVHLLLLSF